MAPIAITWKQPSHPAIQEVHLKDGDYNTLSISKVDLNPFEIFAELNFPPCTEEKEPTYATVQMGADAHFSLNSDLVYINHSCEPSLIFDVGNMNIIAGPKGLKKGEELTFFYPSTEYSMAQGFTCACNMPSCRGYIGGAKELAPIDPANLNDRTALWLNKHINDMLHICGNFPADKALAQAEAFWASAHSNGIGSRAMSGEMGGDTNGKAK